MKTRTCTALLSAALALGASGVVATLAPAPARAEVAPAKIIVVNVMDAYVKSKETVSFNQRMTLRANDYKSQQDQRQVALQKLQSDRAAYSVSSPDYDNLTQQMVKLSVEADVAQKLIGPQLDQQTKQHFRVVMAKIDKIVQDVAKEQSATLVLADNRPDISEDQWNSAQANAVVDAFSRRSVLYVDNSLNQTDIVKARLDAEYDKAGGPPPAPTPAPTPAPGH